MGRWHQRQPNFCEEYTQRQKTNLTCLYYSGADSEKGEEVKRHHFAHTEKYRLLPIRLLAKIPSLPK